MSLTFEERRALRQRISDAKLARLVEDGAAFCEWCGQEFVRIQAGHKFCSKPCRQRAEYDRTRTVVAA